MFADDPKPPGPVELEENVPGTLTVSWDPSPDEKRDNHLHYMVMKRDSIKRTWHTVADRLFNNNFTAINIMPGREYNFRVYAKNDIGLSKPSESQTWGIIRKKGELAGASTFFGLLSIKNIKSAPSASLFYLVCFPVSCRKVHPQLSPIQTLQL